MPEEQTKRKETRVIYAYAKAKGLDHVKINGSKLVADGVRYNHNLLIQNTKTIQVQDESLTKARMLSIQTFILQVHI